MTDSASDDDCGPSPLGTADGDAVEASAVAQGRAEELSESDGSSDAVKRNPDIDVLAKGIACVFGPVMRDFDCGVEGALKSQGVLVSSVDRLTRELDKLLEDVPHPYATHHATRLSGIRKRVISLNTTLRIIQKRMDMIQRLLAGYASREAARPDQGKASLSLMEQSPSTSSYVSLKELPPSEVSSLSPEDKEQAKVEDHEMWEISNNLSSGSLQKESLQEEEVSKVSKEAVMDQESGDRSTASGGSEGVMAQEPGDRGDTIQGVDDVVR